MKKLLSLLLFVVVSPLLAETDFLGAEPIEDLRALYSCNSLIMEIKLIDSNGQVVGRTMESFAQNRHCIEHQGMLARSRSRISENQLIAICNNWKMRVLEITTSAEFRVIDDTFTNSYHDCLQQASATNGSFSFCN